MYRKCLKLLFASFLSATPFSRLTLEQFRLSPEKHKYSFLSVSSSLLFYHCVASSYSFLLLAGHTD